MTNPAKFLLNPPQEESKRSRSHQFSKFESVRKKSCMSCTLTTKRSSARGGVIRLASIPEVEDGDPEAIYIQRNYGGLNYTIETPSTLDLRRRIDAHKAAVGAVL